MVVILKTVTNMKRLLYICVAALLFSACDEIEQIIKPSVNYYFGSPRSETTETSAKIIIDQPFAAVDGEIYNEAVITLGYVRAEDQFVEELTIVKEYETKESVIIFTINDLEPSTQYIAYTFIDAGEHGGKKSEAYRFETKTHTPEYAAMCRASVDAKGIMATITLSEVAYLVDDKEVPFSNVRVEYARKRSELEWIGIDIAGENFSDGTETITIPAEGADYLEEYSPYLYRVVFTPADDQFPTITTESDEFMTEYAEVTAEISTPDVTIVGDNIEIDVESVKVWFDGVERPDYYNLEYYVYYREPGGEQYYWSNKTEVELTNGGISLSLAVASFEEGKEYEFAAAVVAGAEKKVKLSDIVTITIPKEETPTPPTPPTPPVGGDTDTTAIAGDWQLTLWRGAEPSFDVYLSITEDGVVTLWQRIESREWEQFYSTTTLENSVISGEYTDGTAWSASYTVTGDGDTMTWIDTADDADISVYTRCTLPDFNTGATTRSAHNNRFL